MATKFKLPVFSKNKKINTAIYVAIVGLLIYALYRLYLYLKEKRQNQTDPGTTTGGNSATNSGGGASYTDATVFTKKSPYMKDKRVQWIQYRYNQLADFRKNAKLSPAWPKISEDSAFGPATEAAVNRVMAKKSASWAEFSAKANAITSQIQTNGLNVPVNPVDFDGYGYNFQ